MSNMAYSTKMFFFYSSISILKNFWPVLNAVFNTLQSTLCVVGTVTNTFSIFILSRHQADFIKNHDEPSFNPLSLYLPHEINNN